MKQSVAFQAGLEELNGRCKHCCSLVLLPGIRGRPVRALWRSGEDAHPRGFVCGEWFVADVVLS